MTKVRPEWISHKTENEAFCAGEARMLALLHRRFMSNYASPENRQSYKHGRTFLNPGSLDGEGTQMHEHSAELTIKFEVVANNDLKSWIKGLLDIAGQIKSKTAELVYSTMSEVTERTGNVVSTKKSGSMPAAFLKMIEKIEFGVDRQGEVTLPVIHAHPEMGEKMFAELNLQPPSFFEEVERVKEQKSKEAVEKERERISRFKRAE